ncbi:hypothetical protein EV359DRAFT_68993, partial [Lentinula novae-zelandiae]
NLLMQEDHHPQSPIPSSGDTVLSCWETGSQFSYHGSDLGAFGPTPYQRGSLTIPDHEHDAFVRQHDFEQCYVAQRIGNSCYAPRVEVREVEDVEKVMVRNGLVTGVPAGSLLFSI